MVSKFFSLLLVGASFVLAPFVFAQIELTQVNDKENWHNAAVSVASTEGFLYLDKFGVDLSTVSSSDEEVFVYVKAIDEFGEPVGFGHDGSVEIERFRFLGSLPQYVTDYSEIPTLECDKELTDLCTLVYPLVYDPELAFRRQLEHTISLVAKDGGNIVDNKVGNTVTTIYPNADPETVTVDGYTQSAASGENYATKRAASGSSSADSDAVIVAPSFSLSSNPNYWFFRRGFVSFDTSTIGDTDTISSAVLSFFPHSRTDSLGVTPSANVTAMGSATATALVAGDYDDFEDVKFLDTSFAYADWHTDYQDGTLNASGIAHIDKTGITSFGLRFDADIDDSDPSWHTGSGSETISFRGADYGSDKPKLVITHSAPEVPASAPATGVYDWYGDATIAAPDSDEGRWYWDWIITVLLVSMCCVVYVLKDNRSMIINN